MRRSVRAAVSSSTSIIPETMPKSSKAKDTKPPKPSSARGRKRASSKIVNQEPETSPYFASEPEPEAPGTRLGRNFYDQGTIQLAKALLGKVLCRKLPETGQILRGTIVETEAYPGEGDAASHSYKGVPTEASMPMFMDPGTAYVYFTYGMYHCFNVSAKDNGDACLFRAAEVLEDYEIMHSLRRPKKKKTEEEATSTEEGVKKKPEKRLKPHELANGPAKICLAFDIDRHSCNKLDLSTSDELWLETSHNEMYRKGDFEVAVSKRVGIDSTPPEARNQLYRFFIKDNPSVSKAKFKEDTDTKSKKGSSSRSNKRSRK